MYMVALYMRNNREKDDRRGMPKGTFCARWRINFDQSIHWLWPSFFSSLSACKTRRRVLQAIILWI